MTQPDPEPRRKSALIPIEDEPASFHDPSLHEEMEYARREEARRQKQQAKISWMASVAVHAGILLLIGGVVAVDRLMTAPEITVVAEGANEEPVIEKEQLIPQTAAPLPASASAARSEVMENINNNAPVVVPDIQVPVDTGGIGMANAMGVGLGAFGNSGLGGGGFGTPTAMSSRCSKGDRLRRLAEAGGAAVSDEAVVKALRWLKKHQNADGSWGGANPAAMTGLSLLAHMGHCETVDSPEFGESVTKGLLYLIELQQKKGYLHTGGKDQNLPYAHGIASYALTEAYTMTRYGNRRIPGLREAVAAAISVIIESQAIDGGWFYGYAIGGDDNGRGDTSVTGWQIQALNAARYSKIAIDKLQPTFEKAVEYCKNSQGDGGGFGYRRDSGVKPSMTGVGCLCMILGQKDRTGEVKKGVQYLMANFTPGYTSGTVDLYGSYYINQVLFMRGGVNWRTWNGKWNRELLAGQNPDGHFNKESGSGAANSDVAGGDADIYRTCLCTLMLEVFYRYLPATDHKLGSFDDDK